MLPRAAAVIAQIGLAALDAAVWFQRWRTFYMAVAERFGYANGNEWGVGHYRFVKRQTES